MIFFTRSVTRGLNGTFLLLTGLLFALSGIPLHAQTRNALQFDGIDDHVVLDPALAAELSNRQQLTLEIRFTFNALQSYSALFAFRDYRGYNASFIFELQTAGNGGKNLATNISNGREDFRMAYETEMEIGREYLVSVVFDGTQVNTKDRTRMYIDGIAQPLTGGTSAPATTANVAASIPIYLGREVTRYTNYTVSELRLWRTARTAAEIVAYADEGSVDPLASEVIASYTFDKNYAVTDPGELARLEDAGSDGFDGTLQNFAFTGETSNWITQALVLPVELISFSGTTSRTSNELTWTVMAEQDLSHYTVERSAAPGNGWVDITSLPAQANGAFGTHTYTYHDARPLRGYYYRLRIVDLDGTENFSDVIHLDRAWVETLAVYPNPATDKISVRVPVDGTVSLRLLDMAGRVLWNRERDAAALNVPLAVKAPPGIYTLTASGAGRFWSSRLVVR